MALSLVFLYGPIKGFPYVSFIFPLRAFDKNRTDMPCTLEKNSNGRINEINGVAS